LYQLRRIAEFFRIDIRLLIEPTAWTDRTGPSPAELYKERVREEKEALDKNKKTAKKKSAKKTKRRF
jgi:hypothetical protein